MAIPYQSANIFCMQPPNLIPTNIFGYQCIWYVKNIQDYLTGKISCVENTTFHPSHLL